MKKGDPSPNKGKKASPELIEKLRKAHLGKRMSEEAKRKLSEYQKAGNSPFLIDGREKQPGYRAWKKNEHNRKKKTNGGSHTFGEWDILKAQYNWTCPSCFKKEPEIKLTQDHIIPVSKGGSDNIENIQALCLPCNMRS